MLSALLPGLREVRTPLVAGYLWLAAFWLMFGKSITKASVATEITDRLAQAAAAIGPLGSTGALTICAYMVGILSTAMSNAVLVFVSGRLANRHHGMGTSRGRRHSPGASHGYDKWIRTMAADAAGLRVGETLSIITPRGRHSLEVYIRRSDFTGLTMELGEADNAIIKFQKTVRQMATQATAPVLIEKALKSRSYENLLTAYKADAREAYEQEPTAAGKLARDVEHIARFIIATEIADRLRHDLQFVATRLIGTEPDLYNSIDRLTAEGEFRCGISLGLAAAILSSAIYEPTMLIALLVPVALFWLGLRRKHDALENATMALYSKRIWSPVLGNETKTLSELTKDNDQTSQQEPNNDDSDLFKDE